jgi:uncharacterized protein
MTVQAAPPSRLLDAQDLPAVEALLARDPVAAVFVAARLEVAGIAVMARNGELWGYEEDGRLVSLCYAGANLVPVQASPAAVRAFAWRAVRYGRRCSSLVGPASAVLPLWQQLKPHWGPARDVRRNQPLLAVDRDGPVPPDPLVRPVRPEEIATLLPAAVAMFTEEVGVDPRADGGEAVYHARVSELVHSGRAYARIEDGMVLFKAEVGSVSRHACQVQGVWVHPDLRGLGLSEPGMAAVVGYSLRDHAPVVSLYVNDYNTRALAAYEAVGFTQVGAFATVLF